jgi:spore germination cell wall hydrolase CwlJ-like protein
MIKKVIVFVFILLVLPISIIEYHETEKKVVNEIISTERTLRLEFEKQVTCLAKNIFYEAGSESYEGKLAVATVTMNRVNHRQFPNTVCGVVYQSNPRGCQFSWTCGPKAKFNENSYQQAHEIAEQVLTKHIRLNKLKKAIYFHNTSIEPNWDFAEPIQQIGNHIFYEPRRNNPTT